jgi:hypothetical protein
MSQRGEPCIKGHPKITGGIDRVDWLPKELNRSRFWDAPTALSEEHCGALRDIDSDPPFSQPLLWVTEICQSI